MELEEQSKIYILLPEEIYNEFREGVKTLKDIKDFLNGNPQIALGEYVTEIEVMQILQRKKTWILKKTIKNVTKIGKYFTNTIHTQKGKSTSMKTY